MDSIDFIHSLRWEHVPEPVQHQVKRCILDTIGAAVAGRNLPLSEIIYEFVCDTYGGKGAYLWLDGREVSPPGAALAHGMTIDGLDIHDNFNQAKGHAGVAVVPAAFAASGLVPDARISGKELLTTILVGYEVALRGGLALHSTACDYHSSGAWNALGCAAVTARRLGQNDATTRHALGIAEYHGPRSQMMRCIDYPTMLKDGSGWGAMAGVSAGILAHKGFTGAPPLTIVSKEVADIWRDIGSRWYVLEQDFKRHAVCHWAQPAITGLRDLMDTHDISPQDITGIKVFTFHEATRLTCRRPATTEEAQYSLPFPLAAAAFHERLGPKLLNGEALKDKRVLNMADCIELIEDDFCNDQFPNVQLARVVIETRDGKKFESETVESPWDNSQIKQPYQPTDQELSEKFNWLVSDSLTKQRAAEIQDKIWHCDELPDMNLFTNLLSSV